MRTAVEPVRVIASAIAAGRTPVYGSKHGRCGPHARAELAESGGTMSTTVILVIIAMALLAFAFGFFGSIRAQQQVTSQAEQQRRADWSAGGIPIAGYFADGPYGGHHDGGGFSGCDGGHGGGDGGHC